MRSTGAGYRVRGTHLIACMTSKEGPFIKDALAVCIRAQTMPLPSIAASWCPPLNI